MLSRCSRSNYAAQLTMSRGPTAADIMQFSLILIESYAPSSERHMCASRSDRLRVPACSYRIIGILVNRWLLALQAAASAHPSHLRDLGTGERSLSVSSGSERGSVSLLQFVRADIDEWIHSESECVLPSFMDDSHDGARWDEECIAALQLVQRRMGSSPQAEDDAT